jgi:hypothetical protein
MKKHFLNIVVCILAFIGQSQQVPRDKVVLEIGTGTWCQYCPGAANGADDLIENGKQVAVVENHNGDSYANVFSNARNSYYNITGYPTSKFDGILTYVGGGSASQSNYNNYLPLYNQRIAINSSFTIQINGANTGNDYNVIVTITKVATYTGPNPILHFVLTQSNIAQNWQGMTELNFVTRLMVPDQSGTTINFTSGVVQVINLTFTKNAVWPIADCEIIAFLQNNSSKEILQGFKVSLNELVPLGTSTDVSLISIYNVPMISCSGKASPYLKIRNLTNANLYSSSIKYNINQGIPMTFNWTGNLGINQESIFQLPQISFTTLSNNLFTAYIQNANGLPDINNINDTIYKPFAETDGSSSSINLEILTDNNPNQITWQVLNANNQVVFSGGPYTGQPNTLIQQELEFQQFGCYRFIISDSGNDGICCTSGSGYFSLLDSDNQLIYSNGDYGPKETIELNIMIIRLNLTVFLEGAFDPFSFEMRTTLNDEGIISLNQPFNKEPWNYNGLESVTSIPEPNIVDWILVELRETTGGPETATPSTVIGRQAAFINSYGQIVGLDGISNLRFDLEITNNLFIAIYQRNHLPIISSEAVISLNNIYNYDFSASVDNIYGGLQGCKDLIGGVAGMAAGNANGDGLIDIYDLSESWELEVGEKGYFSSDINLNTQVNNQDKNELFINNIGMQSQVPQ